MDFELKMMDFELKTMDFELKMMDFVLRSMDFELKMMDCLPKVLLTGFASGGQQVYLTADTVHAAVKSAAAGLAVFKALPVDGLRADINQVFINDGFFIHSLIYYPIRDEHQPGPYKYIYIKIYI